MITEPIELVASVETMGQPYHGPIVGSTLTLPNGASMPVAFADQQTLAYDLSAVLTHFGPRGNTAYVKFAGLPAVAAPSVQEAAEGVVWYDDAVLFGQTRQYSPRSATLFVPRLFRDAYGVVWEIDTAVVYPDTIASHQDISTAPTSGPVSLTVRAKKFGLDVTDSWHALVSYADTLDVQPALRAIEDAWRADPLYTSGVPYYWVGDARQFTNEPVAVPWRPPLVQASPDGSRQLVALYYRKNDDFTAARWTIAKVYRVSISSGASHGTPPVASVAVAKSVTDCMSWTVTTRSESAATKRTADSDPPDFILPPQPDVVPWQVVDYEDDADIDYAYIGSARVLLLATFDSGGAEVYIESDYAEAHTLAWVPSGSASGSFARVDDTHWNGSASYNVANTATLTDSYTMRILRNGAAAVTFSDTRVVVNVQSESASWTLTSASPASPYTAENVVEDSDSSASGSSSAGGAVGAGGGWSGAHFTGFDPSPKAVSDFPPPVARAWTNNIAMTDIALSGATAGDVFKAMAGPSGAVVTVGVEAGTTYRYASWNPRSGALAHGLTPVGWV